MSDEAGLTALKMSNRIADAIQSTIDNFKPRSRYDLIKVENSPKKLIEHKLTGY